MSLFTRPFRFHVEQAENNALEDVRQRHVFFFRKQKIGDVEGDEKNLAY